MLLAFQFCVVIKWESIGLGLLKIKLSPSMFDSFKLPIPLNDLKVFPWLYMLPIVELCCSAYRLSIFSWDFYVGTSEPQFS